MRKHKAIVFIIIAILLSFTLVSFADSNQDREESVKQEFEILAREIEEKIEDIKQNKDSIATVEQEQMNNTKITPQYEPIHECHDGPGHEECDLVAGKKESCGCYGGMLYCCCGKKMSFYYFYCPRHR